MISIHRFMVMGLIRKKTKIIKESKKQVLFEESIIYFTLKKYVNHYL